MEGPFDRDIDRIRKAFAGDGKREDIPREVGLRHVHITEKLIAGRPVLFVLQSGPYEHSPTRALPFEDQSQLVGWLNEQARIHREVADDLEMAAAAVRAM